MPTDTSTLFEQPAPTERQLVLFFDECIGRVPMEALVSFLGMRPESPKCIYLQDLFKQGVRDREWLSRAKEEGWLPVTADRGRSNRGEKLPRICRELEIIHIVLSASVYTMPAQDQALAIVAVWQDIVRVWREQIGCRHSLRKGDRAGFKLVDMDSRKNLPK